MRTQRLLIQQPFPFRTRLGIGALTCALVASGQARAEDGADPSSPTASTRADTGEKRPFHFKTSCGIDRGGSLSIAEGDSASTDDGEHLPELGTCLVSGNQDRARYTCLCADREGAISGDIEAASIPSLGKPSKVDRAGRGVQETFWEMCQEQLNKACGPFPKPIDVSCSNENVRCDMSVHGSRRDAGYNVIRSECNCRQEAGWEIHQEFKGDFSIDEAGLQSQCEAALSSCTDESTTAHFLPAQRQARDQFVSQTFGCGDHSGGRWDDCWVQPSLVDDLQRFRCECSGNVLTGQVEERLDESAPSLQRICYTLLDSCVDFEPKKPERPEGWPDDWGKGEPVDPSQGSTGGGDSCGSSGSCTSSGGSTQDPGRTDAGADISDAVKRLGCNAALGDKKGLPAALGLGTLLLWGRLRRRR